MDEGTKKHRKVREHTRWREGKGGDWEEQDVDAHARSIWIGSGTGWRSRPTPNGNEEEDRRAWTKNKPTRSLHEHKEASETHPSNEWKPRMDPRERIRSETEREGEENENAHTHPYGKARDGWIGTNERTNGSRKKAGSPFGTGRKRKPKRKREEMEREASSRRPARNGSKAPRRKPNE
eukprot:scaffold1997_cov318-Pavlova_lutheri.AAC.1